MASLSNRAPSSSSSVARSRSTSQTCVPASTVQCTQPRMRMEAARSHLPCVSIKHSLRCRELFQYSSGFPEPGAELAEPQPKM